MLVYDIWLKEKSRKTASVLVMSSDCSRHAQVYFCVQLSAQTGTWSHKETSGLVEIGGRCWELCGPSANPSDTCNPWKIYGVYIQNLIDGLNVTGDLNENDDQNEFCLLNFLPNLICGLYSCDHPVFCVSLYHCNI